MEYDYMIYPKQFRTARIPVEKNFCFFLMPFNEQFDAVYATIKEQLMDSNYICNRADELNGSKPIMNKILVEILRAQYIIVDLTDCNPNVFYELGIAHTFKDSQNVLLLKQKGSKVPFDITHLQYREYSPNNLKQLTSIIKEFISNNQSINDFHDALLARGIITSISDNQETFLDYLHNRLGDDIVTITKILNYQYKEVEDTVIEDALDRYQLLVHRSIEAKMDDILQDILRLYIEMLISCSSYLATETHVSFFLGDFFAQHKLSMAEVLDHQTNMAVALATKKKQLMIVLPWIINYFSRSKAATIDLNRYKLESFLMTTEYEEINQAIVNAVFSKDCHIREHLADIIGEKRLTVAKDALFMQLMAEENYYTAVSIIEAIGKLGQIDGIAQIEKWTKKHIDDIIESKMFSVFRHIKNAVIRLDSTPDHKYISALVALFDRYITEDVPL